MRRRCGCGCSPGWKPRCGKRARAHLRAAPPPHVAGNVFDEGGVVVGLHRHVALIGTLEQRIDRRRASASPRLRSGPRARRAVRRRSSTVDLDVAALVVCAVVADLLAARAQTRDGDPRRRLRARLRRGRSLLAASRRNPRAPEGQLTGARRSRKYGNSSRTCARSDVKALAQLDDDRDCAERVEDSVARVEAPRRSGSCGCP